MVAPASSSSAVARASARAKSAGAGSTTSTALKSVRSKAPLPPHYLGGSNNLVSERSRRERAETALQRTKLSLHTVAEELVPQVEQLSNAIKTIQIEKHQQLDLDEASQEVLEALQQQLNELETQQRSFPHVVEERLEALVQQIREQTRAENYELKVLIANVHDAQDDLVAEFRLLHHELTASHEFLSKRMNAVDDAVECIRRDVTRAGELQFQSNQSVADRVCELDEKLFVLDKEVLKVKLALPSAVAAQIASPFTDRHGSSLTGGKGPVELPSGSMALQQKLQELSTEIAALKADAATYRAADRKLFDGLTNRLRESAKSHQSLKNELDTRLQQLQSSHDQMVTKVPSELAKRLLAAQRTWDTELQNLRASVQQIETNRAKETTMRDQRLHYGFDASSDLDGLLIAMQSKLGTVEGLRGELVDVRNDVQLLHDGQDTTLKALSSSVNRVETDLLGLYDWSREKVAQLQEEVTYSSAMLAYFNAHAKILPK